MGRGGDISSARFAQPHDYVHSAHRTCVHTHDNVHLARRTCVHTHDYVHLARRTCVHTQERQRCA